MMAQCEEGPTTALAGVHLSGRPIRVMHVVEAIGHGTGRHVLSILKHWDRAEFAMSVASPAARKGEEDESSSFVAGVRESGADWYEVPLIRQPHAWSDGRSLLRLLQVIRQSRADLVHTHSSKAGFLGRAAAKLLGVPSLYTPNGFYFLRFPCGTRRTAFVLLERLAARWGDRIICVSPSERDAARAARLATSQELLTIANGVEIVARRDRDTSRGTLRTELGLAPDSTIVGCVARLSAQKDPETLIRAIEPLSESVGRPVHLVWCGDGELRRDMEALARRTGLGERAHFLGFRTDVLRITAGLDAFVLPSRYEGLPYALLEAMGAGVPVVATDVEGNRDLVIDGETGLLVKAGSVAQMTTAIARLLLDGGLADRFAERARAITAERYSARAMVQQLEALYRTVFRARLDRGKHSFGRRN